MKKLSLFLVFACLVGCEIQTPERPEANTKTKRIDNGVDRDLPCSIYRVEFDGCAYIIAQSVVNGGSSISICHDGTCNNPKHGLPFQKR